jgi:hypothetical protein
VVDELIDASHVALMECTGSLLILVFQTLSYGNAGQLVPGIIGPVGAAPAGAVPATRVPAIRLDVISPRMRAIEEERRSIRRVVDRNRARS